MSNLILNPPGPRETSVGSVLAFVFSSTDTVSPPRTNPDPGWASCAGAGPAGPDPADHHPAAPDSRHCWPDPGNSTVSVSTGAQPIWKDYSTCSRKGQEKIIKNVF